MEETRRIMPRKLKILAQLGAPRLPFYASYGMQADSHAEFLGQDQMTVGKNTTINVDVWRYVDDQGQLRISAQVIGAAEGPWYRMIYSTTGHEHKDPVRRRLWNKWRGLDE